MNRFDRRWPAAGLLVVLSALGTLVDQRSPRWLQEDPMLRPFGLTDLDSGDGAGGPIPPAGTESAEHRESSAAIPEPTPESPLDLRTATAQELCALPGIGPVLAARIVVLRDSLGTLKRVDDLLRVKGIGPVRLRRLRPLLRWKAAGASGGAVPDES